MGTTTKKTTAKGKNELRRWRLKVIAYDECGVLSSQNDDRCQPWYTDVFAKSQQSAESIAKKVFVKEIAKKYQLADYFGIAAYSDPIVIGVDVEKSSTAIGGYQEIEDANHSEGWNNLHEVQIDNGNWFRYYEGEPWEDPTSKSTKKAKKEPLADKKLRDLCPPENRVAHLTAFLEKCGFRDVQAHDGFVKGERPTVDGKTPKDGKHHCATAFCTAKNGDKYLVSTAIDTEKDEIKHDPILMRKVAHYGDYNSGHNFFPHTVAEVKQEAK